MQSQIEYIDLNLIDEPEHAMRSDIHDDELVALSKSIEQFGLLQPVTLRKLGDRYEVIAGHRRTAAHKYLGRQRIAAIVREADDVTTDAIKVHENLYRADVNPVDQASFLYEYMQRSNLTIEQLAEQLNRTVSWVQSRVQILTYPPYLIEFVGEGKLSMATAEILNQIKNEPLREKYCRDAAIIGLSAARAKFWLAQASLASSTPGQVSVEPPQEGDMQIERPVLKLQCVFDGEQYPAELMTMVYVNIENLKAYQQAIEEARISARYDTEGAVSETERSEDTARA